MIIIERIIFSTISFAMFIVYFLKLIKKNDTSYIDILGLQFLGIAINFIGLLFGIKYNIIVYIIMYFLCIIIPGIFLFLETKKNLSFPEFINLFIAKIYLLKNDEETAKKYIFKVIKNYPQSYIAHKKLAEIYEKQNKLSNAIDEYVRAIEINKKDYNSYYKIAFFLKELDRNDEAIKMLNDLIKFKPDYLEASILLGDVLYIEERFKEAAVVYQDALLQSPGNFDLYYSLGMVYTMLNDFQKAKEYYQKAADINSLSFNGKFSMAQIALIYGDLEEARRIFMECIDIENLESGSYYYLAQIAMLKGEKEMAINYINIAIEQDFSIYKKIQGEIIFAPIIKRINPPTKNQNQVIIVNKLSKKEEMVKKHLEDTYYLVNKLNNNDLTMMKNIKEAIKKEQNQKLREE